MTGSARVSSHAHLNSAKRQPALVIDLGREFLIGQFLSAGDRNPRQSAMCPTTVAGNAFQVAVAGSGLNSRSDRDAAFSVKARAHHLTFPCTPEQHSLARL